MNCTVLNSDYGVTFVGGYQVDLLYCRVLNSTEGIMSQFSNRTVIENCTVAFNGRGIDVDEFNLDWLILNCSVVNNTEFGIGVGPHSGNMTIALNKIGWNTLNARDDGLTNYWDEGPGKGNAWSDYSGIGVYVVQGTAGSVDHFPAILIH
jgi:nitrous oxidase accessory protein NosD